MNARRFAAWYRRTFSIEELEGSRPLQYLFWAVLLGFVVAFSDWYPLLKVTRQHFLRGDFVCPDYFQGCGRLFFLEKDPHGHSYGAFFALLLALMTGAAAAAARARWSLAHLALLPLFAAKLFIGQVLYKEAGSNFEYFHLPFAFVLLFCSHKLAFARAAFSTLYFLAATAKHHESWVAGTYFSALRGGMPLVQDGLVPFATNAVILLETAGPWLLWSGDPRLRRGALGLWLLFHFYSVTFVGLRYPLHCVPILLALFGTTATPRPPPFERRALAGWVLLASLFALQAAPRLISGGDYHLTLEGKGLGLSMFESNHQCVASTRVYDESGALSFETRRGSRSATYRCRPYAVWFVERQRCGRPGQARVELRLDKSINGGPFYRVIDAPDVCALEYSPWRRNAWIRAPADGAPLVGYAARDRLGSPRGGLDPGDAGIILEAPVETHHPLQRPFLARLDALILLWRLLWLTALLLVGRRLLCRRESW